MKTINPNNSDTREGQRRKLLERFKRAMLFLRADKLTYVQMERLGRLYMEYAKLRPITEDDTDALVKVFNACLVNTDEPSAMSIDTFKVEVINTIDVRKLAKEIIWSK